MGEVLFYLGGAKSGKTRLAQARAETWPGPRTYLATAEALDAEMVVRIKNHQAERGPDWITVEAPLEPDLALTGPACRGPVMVDCLTLWLSNLLGLEENHQTILSRVDRLVQAAKSCSDPVVIVSNEVGGGIVPMNALARQFRDLAGAANQRVAAGADQVYLVAAGLELKLK